MAHVACVMVVNGGAIKGWARLVEHMGMKQLCFSVVFHLLMQVRNLGNMLWGSALIHCQDLLLILV